MSRISKRATWALLLFAVLLAATLACSEGVKFVDNDACSDINRDALPKTIVKLHFDTGYLVEADAEVASTGQQHLQGLMCRSEVKPATGMLFLFDTPRTGQFWMFNTYVDLDIVYIAPDGSVADVKRMTACLQDGDSRAGWSARCDSESRQYIPANPYDATLELPAGWLESETNGNASLVSVTWD